MSENGEILTDMGLLSQFSYKLYGVYPVLANTNINSFEDDGITYALNSSYTVIDFTPEETLTGMQAMLLQKTGTDLRHRLSGHFRWFGHCRGYIAGVD